jgi:hypothetical protein
VLRRVCGCVLCVGEANKAVVAKQWQCYTSVCFRPGGKMSDRLLEQRNTVKVRLSGNSSVGKIALAAYFHRAHYNSPVALAAYFCRYPAVV